jgi:hypothetical protein
MVKSRNTLKYVLAPTVSIVVPGNICKSSQGPSLLHADTETGINPGGERGDLSNDQPVLSDARVGRGGDRLRRGRGKTVKLVFEPERLSRKEQEGSRRYYQDRIGCDSCGAGYVYL